LTLGITPFAFVRFLVAGDGTGETDENEAKTKWPDEKSAPFGGLAVYAYCRDKLPH
jgi:hypothetical protein